MCRVYPTRDDGRLGEAERDGFNEVESARLLEKFLRKA
jgi:hypothetical protein